MGLLRHVLRIPYAIGLWERFPVGPIPLRVYHGIFPYPQYAYGVYWSAMLAARLKLPRITVIELGVAGGRGLVALEDASALIEREVGVGIDVVGFDTGEGMPAPTDYRDLPHTWGGGFYRMDQDKLRARLKRARLILGDVGTTTRRWLESEQRAPIGFVSFDMDYYTSTKAALCLFEGPEPTHLPRVHCHFDDVLASPTSCMNEYVGELLAIREFNEGHPQRKICRIAGMHIHRPRRELWHEQTYAFHNFAHSQYNTLAFVPNEQNSQLPL
jgi:hypothetical protein